MRLRTLMLVCLLTIGMPAAAETIAVIGTGNVGMALGTELAQHGHTIIYGSRSPLGTKGTRPREEEQKVIQRLRHPSRLPPTHKSSYSPFPAWSSKRSS